MFKDLLDLAMALRELSNGIKMILTKGNYLLFGTSAFTLAVILGSQTLLKSFRVNLTPLIPESKLWSFYRWSIDPSIRREAALLLVAKSKDSPLRVKALLQGQGWGKDQLAGISLKLQAQTFESLGKTLEANNIWKSLLRKFPKDEVSADSYYSLGRENINYRKTLLQLHPAHPAALASAIEMDQPLGIVHLARWGVRWPGAEQLFRKECLNPIQGRFTSDEKEIIARALATLGDGQAALNCLDNHLISLETTFAIGNSLLQGNESQRIRGRELLIKLIETQPESQESSKSIKALAKHYSPIDELVNQLSKDVVDNSPELSALRVRYEKIIEVQEIFDRWHDHPAIWHLQWQIAREALLEKKWSKAYFFFNLIPTKKLPVPIASRKEFWKGFILYKQNKSEEARKIWEDLVRFYPNNYYTWRASFRLGIDSLSLLREKENTAFKSEPSVWYPLASKDDFINKLWRLGLFQDAWEIWRNRNFSTIFDNASSIEDLVEGRLRMQVGDDWMGLVKLRETSLNLLGEGCLIRELLHRSQHPYRFWTEIELASIKTGLSSELLLAIAKQESRFSPSVKSNMGALGLMQLMLFTAREVDQSSLTEKSLFNAQKNILLGAKYLITLVEKWKGNPLLVIASYNAGPNKVEEWVSLELASDPELWVERIPYPETRFYTKKVLGNLWAYLGLDKRLCKVSY